MVGNFVVGSVYPLADLGPSYLVVGTLVGEKLTSPLHWSAVQSLDLVDMSAVVGGWMTVFVWCYLSAWDWAAV